MDCNMFSTFKLKLIVKVLQNTAVQKFFGANLVWNLFKFLFITVFFLQAIYELFKPQNGFLSDASIEGKSFTLLVYSIFLFELFFVYFKYRFLVRNRDNPTIGLWSVSVSDNGSPAFVLNIRFIRTYSIVDLIMSFCFLTSFGLSIGSSIRSFNLAYLSNAVVDIIFVIFLLPLFNFLYFDNSTKTIYSTVKEKAEDLIAKTTEVLAPQPSPIPSPVKV